MMAELLCLVAALTLQDPPATNPVQHRLMDRGVQAGGATVPLAKPTFPDGQDAGSSRAALRAVVGDERGEENFLRDSVTAPFVLKTRDIKAEGATIRVADLWFAVRGRLDDIDLKQILGGAAEKTAEAGNMRFATKIQDERQLAERNLSRPPSTSGREEWYTLTQARLLDRIKFEITDHTVATRTTDSITVASVTTPVPVGTGMPGNYWATSSRSGGVDAVGPPQNYAGGGSYAKITRLAADPGVLIIEGHFAFVEPDPWFDGNPILRSKIALICQDQIRQLRREIQKRRPPG